MNRVSSFTECTLLHRWALDLLSPPDFQKLQIPYAGDSVLEALKNSPKNPYSNLKNVSWWHFADQYYLLTPLKAACVAAVTLTISRLGVVYHGSKTLFYYLKYRISVNPGTIKNSWEKTKEHACAFFVDGLCAGLGALLTKTAVECTIYFLHFARISPLLGPCYASIKNTLLFVTMSVAGAILAIGALACVQSYSVASEFFPPKDHKVGMYLSLFFRKKLGLVGPGGGLLPFSANDKLEYQETPRGVTFSGSRNDEILWSNVFNAELELIEAIQTCNYKLLPPEQRIRFHYPLDGEAIARELESRYAQGDKNAGISLMSEERRPIFLKAAEIRALQLKIKYSKEIWATTRKLTYDDGFLMRIWKAAFNIPTRSLRISPLVSCLEEEDYKDYFTSFKARFCPPPPRSSSSKKSSSGNRDEALPNLRAQFRWSSIDIPSIDPNRIPRPAAGIFEQFYYDVAVNKWKEEHNRTDFKGPRDLLGLASTASYSEYKEARRRYVLKFHPDRNKGDPAFGELQACLNALLEKLDEEYRA